MKKLSLMVLLLLSQTTLAAENLIILSLDGLRWQEVFQGADRQLIDDERYTEDSEVLAREFWREDVKERRETLMPFFWDTLATQGVFIGDRSRNSRMRVSNPWYFSYPGYNELLTGKADPEINSNKKVPNNNVTFLEWLNHKPEYAGKVAAFGSWDVFPYIINAERTSVPVNAGFMDATGKPLSMKEAYLNELQAQTPSPWETVRLDVFTFNFALEYLKREQPRVVYISLGETDDFAHDGEYDQYLRAAHRSDTMIRQLWDFLQGHDAYRNNTNLLLTSDHGRGSTPEDWQHHASAEAVKTYMEALAETFPNGVEGSETTWFAAIGPDIKPLGNFTPAQEVTLSQVLPTGLTTLGEIPKSMNPDMDTAITEVLR